MKKKKKTHIILIKGSELGMGKGVNTKIFTLHWNLIKTVILNMF